MRGGGSLERGEIEGALIGRTEDERVGVVDAARLFAAPQEIGHRRPEADHAREAHSEDDAQGCLPLMPKLLARDDRDDAPDCTCNQHLRSAE